MANESYVARAVSHILETVYAFKEQGTQPKGSPHYYYSSAVGHKVLMASYDRHFDYLWGVGDHKDKGFIDELSTICKDADKDRPFDVCLLNDSLPPKLTGGGNAKRGQRFTTF